MTFAKGCRAPDPVKHASHKAAAAHPLILAQLAAALPPSADKLPARPRCDQGSSGSCTWGSFSIAAPVACESKGIPLGFTPSQLLGYGGTRGLERAAATPPGQPLPALIDSGADVEDVYIFAGRYGVEPMKTSVTSDGRFYDIEDGPNPPSNVNDEPNTADLEAAAETRILLDVQAHTISPIDPKASDLMAAALSADPPLPIHACGFVDTAFENLQAGQVAQAPDPTDKAGGGHAYWFSKYRTAASGDREFFLENSWGSSWADGGGVWCSMAFVRAQWAMYVLDVRVQKGSS